MYQSNHNQEIIRLILRLRTIEDEYPNRMLTARRVSFLILISQYVSTLIRMR